MKHPYISEVRLIVKEKPTNDDAFNLEFELEVREAGSSSFKKAVVIDERKYKK